MVGRRKLPDLALNGISNALLISVPYPRSFQWINFVVKYLQKGYYWSSLALLVKFSIIKFSIFELVSLRNFSLDQQFLFFGHKLPKKCVPF